MRKAFLLLLAASAVPGGAAVAQPNGGQPPQTSERVQDNAQVCRRAVVVGSILPRRLCRTPAEWAEMERQAQEAMDERRRNSPN